MNFFWGHGSPEKPSRKEFSTFIMDGSFCLRGELLIQIRGHLAAHTNGGIKEEECPHTLHWTHLTSAFHSCNACRIKVTFNECDYCSSLNGKYICGMTLIKGILGSSHVNWMKSSHPRNLKFNTDLYI